MTKEENFWIRRLVYAYFFLLILEGALRKWIFPSMSGPLLIIRDPILLTIYATALYRGIWPWNRWIFTVLGLAVASVILSLAVGCPLTITLFGLRTDFWQIPLIFLMPSILTGQEVRRIGRWMLLMMPAMAVLALLQFRAGPEHWLNATTGGVVSEQSQQLFAAQGRVRPSGTFSFVTGMVSFLALGSAFVFEAFLEGAGRMWLWLVTGTMVLALGISGSRSAILCVGIVAAAAGLMCAGNPGRMRRIAAPLAAAALAFAALHGLADFRQGLVVDKGRFDSAGGLKEGIVYRWFSDFVSAWEAEREAPWLGEGLGLGTNVGAGLATGTRQFLLAEGEWARVILESGPVLGLAFIALRVGIAIYLLRRAVRSVRERDDALPGLLLAAGAFDLITGQWGQATVSGFAVLTAGLCLASSADEDPELETEPEEKPEPVTRVRGRGAFAVASQDRRK
jgi:hypothetical protein